MATCVLTSYCCYPVDSIFTLASISFYIFTTIHPLLFILTVTDESVKVPSAIVWRQFQHLKYHHLSISLLEQFSWSDFSINLIHTVMDSSETRGSPFRFKNFLT